MDDSDENGSICFVAFLIFLARVSKRFPFFFGQARFAGSGNLAQNYVDFPLKIAEFTIRF